MAHALALAWRKGVARVWVHTCTLDHPAALGFYRASGFTPIRRTIETFADPRALGVLPRDAASQIPYLADRRRSNSPWLSTSSTAPPDWTAAARPHNTAIARGFNTFPAAITTPAQTAKEPV